MFLNLFPKLYVINSLDFFNTNIMQTIPRQFNYSYNQQVFIYIKNQQNDYFLKRA